MCLTSDKVPIEWDMNGMYQVSLWVLGQVCLVSNKENKSGQVAGAKTGRALSRLRQSLGTFFEAKNERHAFFSLTALKNPD